VRPLAYLAAWVRARWLAAWYRIDRDGCPLCGSEVVGGYGLAGGGYGPYLWCSRIGCRFFVKRHRAVDEE
jgi:hypothetical protein